MPVGDKACSPAQSSTETSLYRCSTSREEPSLDTHSMSTQACFASQTTAHCNTGSTHQSTPSSVHHVKIILFPLIFTHTRFRNETTCNAFLGGSFCFAVHYFLNNVNENKVVTYHLWRYSKILTLRVSLSLVVTYQSFLHTKELTVNPEQPLMFL